MDYKIKIGTHSGTFHCDEALACYLLRCTNKYHNWDVVRTRDTEILKQLPILVDVGGEYDHENARYDHHQRGFEQTLTSNHKIKLSSAGLIYKHYGREIIKSVTNVSDQDVEKLFFKVYTDFVEALDGIDNGVSAYPQNVSPNYRVTTDLSSRVGYLNPLHDEKDVDIQSRFHAAMELAGSEFLVAVKIASRQWLPALNLVKEAIVSRMNIDSSGQIILLNNVGQWKSHLYEIEDELKLNKPILYVLFADSSAGQWRVQAVPERHSAFASRLPLPEPWRGLRDAELSEIANIPQCVFCHHSGFIGGNVSYEGVLSMAQKSIALSYNK